MQSFEELVKFEKSQQNTPYSNDLLVRCVNIAFTIYLKLPEKQLGERQQVEAYIKENRYTVLKNKKTIIKLKTACALSYGNLKWMRTLFKILNR